MTIQIDLALLEEVNLTPDDFVYLYILHRKGFSYLEKIPLRVSPRLDGDGWVTYGENEINHVVQQKFRDLFVTDFDSMFAELVDAYPFKVESARGVRVLRAQNPKAASNKKARNKYKKIVSGKPHIHKFIMRCLNTQLESEQHNLGYMQNFETWINNCTWEKYEDINIKDIKDDRRITRKL
mgnify:CR=1 FL=1|tara:strand:- start:608 stop:1150 length:543 start_codon:yes stop_codon:yes gene_type:complete